MKWISTGGLSDALKGINGSFELNRLVGFFGGIAYVVCGNFFVWYQTVWSGREFDITAYCLAFPGGLAVIAGGTAGAVAWKDKAVASARVTEATGTIPTKAPDGPKTPVGTDVSEPKPDEVDLAP